MVEQLCGEGVCTNFEDEACCGADPPFPSDDESTSDDSVEEVYVTPATKLTAQFSEKSQSQKDMNKCAAGERCGMKTTPLDGLHSCMNCSKHMHGFCVELFGMKGGLIVGWR